MRNLLLKTLAALLCLLLLFQVAALLGLGSALAQPARPTLTPAPPTATRKPDRDPTDTPVPTATELPTATAAPAPTEPPPPTPTAAPAPAPAQLPTTGGEATNWSAALLLALLLLGAGALLTRTKGKEQKTKR
jgi:LPXTG-motif cell wall-anchored protein